MTDTKGVFQMRQIQNQQSWGVVCSDVGPPNRVWDSGFPFAGDSITTSATNDVFA